MHVLPQQVTYPECLQDPLMAALTRDLERVLPENLIAAVHARQRHPEPRPYRNVTTELGELERGTVLSLEQICHGMRGRGRRWRDYGTGLSKSSVAKAINEAIRAGILVRKQQKTAAGRDLRSVYTVNWDRVLEVDWRRKKGLDKVSARRTPSTG